MIPRSLLLLPLVAFLTPALRAEYRIGQTEIPSVEIKASEAEFQVYPGHPRLFFRDTDLPAIRARIAGEYRAEWERWMKHLEAEVLSQPPAAFAKHPHLKVWGNARGVLLAALLTGETRYLDWAREWFKTLVAAGPVGNDTQFRGRLQCLALAYDWLYPLLTPEERRALEGAVLAHVDRAWYFADGATNYIGGHSRWGNFTLAAGLLALATERPELREKLLVLRRHWVDGYFPAQGWIAQDGGYHMGWAYSAAYLTGSIHLTWSTATNECVLFPWQAKLPLFWLYGRQGDGTYPNTGDAYTITDDLNAYHPDLLAIAGGIFKDPYAAGAWRDRPDRDRLADILYGDKRVMPRAPDDSAASLELARHFRNSGVVVARDRWDKETTLLQFRSTPFFSTNHLHRDANSFTLHYRGDLALDSGLYDESPRGGGYGGVHWRNYFTRTIAHNAIVVFDPAQEMRVIDEPASNDGGQVFRRDPETLHDIQPGGHAHLDGVTRYEHTAGYTYMAGDATKAYDPARVRLAQREVVYLRETARDRPVVVVFDRVESAKPAFVKRFLLHTVNRPTVDGDQAVTEHHGGRLTSVTLLPEAAKLELVGGPGKEAWVNGKNYPWDPTSSRLRGRDLGQWRLEVSPARPDLRDYFLHVLYVDAADAPPVKADDARLTKTASGATVRVAGWEVEFPYAPGAAARIERRP